MGVWLACSTEGAIWETRPEQAMVMILYAWEQGGAYALASEYPAAGAEKNRKA